MEVAVPSAGVEGDRVATVVVPPGAEPRPVVLFLHGRGADADDYLTDSFFTAIEALGAEAPAVVFPDGGDASYWHDREDGSWGTYAREDVLRAVAGTAPEAVDPSRVAVGGISMGGFGALLQLRDAPARWCGVGAHSPAIFFAAEDTAPGAFDDAEDFAANDLIASAGEPGAFGTAPIRIDIGADDPFEPATQAFVDTATSAGTEVALSVEDGGHEGSYWDARWSDYLGYYADVLADC